MEKQTYILDRIEGTTAVLLPQADGPALEVPVAELPCGSHEGCVLHLCCSEWILDAEAEQKRREHLQNKLKMLLEKNK